MDVNYISVLIIVVGAAGIMCCGFYYYGYYWGYRAGLDYGLKGLKEYHEYTMNNIKHL